jgi:hypothetical protein
MSKMQTQLTKIQSLSTKCKDKKLVETYISRFFTQTKDAVENLISMSEIVYEMNSKVENAELTMNDLNYFCLSIGMTTSSSNFRKHVCIGRKADYLKRLIKDIPSAISTVYEITTIDPDEIEKFIEWKKLTPSTTLAELKMLAFKKPNITSSKSTPCNFIKIEFDPNNLSFELKKKFLDFVLDIQNQVVVKFPLMNEFEDICNVMNDDKAKELTYA